MTQAEAVAPAQASRALVIGLCFAAAVLEGYDIQAMGVVARKLATSLALSPGEMGWAFAISNVGLVLGAAGGGWLSDRFGRRPVFAGSVAMFGLFTLATVFATDFAALFALRFLTGLGFGGAIPNMMAIAAEISAPARRAFTSAMMFCGMPLGGAASALFTASLPADFDWRLVFLVGGAAPLIVAAAIQWKLPETRNEPHMSVSPRVAFALFGEGRSAPTLLLWIAFLPAFLILYLLLNWLPTLAIAQGVSEAAAPRTSLAFNVCGVAGGLLIGLLADRARWTIPLGFAALALVLVLLSGARSGAMIFALSGLAGFALLGVQYALYGIAASYYPASVRATGSGATTAVGRVGSIIGPLAAGMALAAGMSGPQVLLWLAPLAVVSGAAVLGLSFFRTAD